MSRAKADRAQAAVTDAKPPYKSDRHTGVPAAPGRQACGATAITLGGARHRYGGVDGSAKAIAVVTKRMLRRLKRWAMATRNRTTAISDLCWATNLLRGPIRSLFRE